MGIVHIFAERKVDPSNKAAGAAKNDNKTGEVVELVVKTKPLNSVPTSPVFGQMRAMLVSHGADFTCQQTRDDFNLMTQLVVGIFDRLNGQVTKQSCIGAAIRYAMEPPSADDTQDIFGDLLGQID